MKQILSLALALLAVGPAIGNDDKYFSGPQKGETLARFSFRAVYGKSANQKIDLIKMAAGKPVAIFFVHSRTRPAFGLVRTMSEYAARRKKDGLHTAVIFLTDDATETQNWMKRISTYTNKGVLWGISLNGVEGPGSYGLNRNVSVTALIGKQGKVTANYALVQPSLEVDGPKILKSVADVLGGGKAPTLAALSEDVFLSRAKMDGELEKLLRGLLRLKKDAKAEDVTAAARAIEKHVAGNRQARRLIGATMRKMIRSQEIKKHPDLIKAEIRRLARKYANNRGRRAPQRKKKKRPGNANAPNLRPYLAPVINKDATPKQVDAAAARLDKFVANNAAAAKELGRIARTVSNSDRFDQYGIARAREHLKRWAKKYGTPKKKSAARKRN